MAQTLDDFTSDPAARWSTIGAAWDAANGELDPDFDALDPIFYRNVTGLGPLRGPPWAPKPFMSAPQPTPP